MATTTRHQLMPRKWPRQQRARMTVDAITEATIQVLRAKGADHLTTTDVAERAGVSVGSLYQYFPNKNALFYEILRQHLEGIGDALEASRVRYQGSNLATISDGLVADYLDAKLARIDVSQALYQLSPTPEVVALRTQLMTRIDVILKSMLTSAADAVFDQLDIIVFAVRSLLVGVVRTVIEEGAAERKIAQLKSELATLCRAYLMAQNNSSKVK